MCTYVHTITHSLSPQVEGRRPISSPIQMSQAWSNNAAMSETHLSICRGLLSPNLSVIWSQQLNSTHNFSIAALTSPKTMAIATRLPSSHSFVFELPPPVPRLMLPQSHKPWTPSARMGVARIASYFAPFFAKNFRGYLSHYQTCLSVCRKRICPTP